MLIDTQTLKTIKTFAAELGRKERKAAFTPAYLYQLFSEDNQNPAAKELRQSYQLVQIDGVKFIVAKTDIPKTRKKA